MTQAFAAVSAIVPSLLLMWYFHRRDVFPEPARDLWLVFAGGVLVVAPVLVIARPIDPWLTGVSDPIAYGLAAAFLQAAIPEELFKLLVLWVAAGRAAFDEPMDGVVYGVAASLGFATLENVVYVSGGGLPVAVTRAFTAVPCHAFLGAIMGYFVGRAKFEPAARRSLLALALAVPTLLHGLYDWPLLAAARVGSSDAGSEPLLVALLSLAPLVVVGEWICAVRLTRGLRFAQLAATAGDGWVHVPTRVERWSSIGLTCGGALVASAGGMLMLGVSLVAAGGGLDGRALGQAAATVALLGVTPTLIGVALFLWGLRRMNDERPSNGTGR